MRGLAQSKMTINFAMASSLAGYQLKTRILEGTGMGTLVLTDDVDRSSRFWAPGEGIDAGPVCRHLPPTEFVASTQLALNPHGRTHGTSLGLTRLTGEKSLKRALASLVSICAVAAVPVPAHAGGTLTGATSHGSASVVVQDVAFDGPDCASAPIAITYAKTPTEADEIALTVEVSASQQGSNSPEETSSYIGFYDPASGTTNTSFSVCNWEFPDSAGPIAVTGTLTSKYYVNSSTQTVTLVPPGTLNLVKNQSVMSTPRVTKAYSWSDASRKISGRATATTLTKGVVGAGGTIQIYAKYPGSKRWVGGSSTSPDEFGNWSTTVSKAPKGTLLRISLVDCGWCTNVDKTVKVVR